MIQNLLIALALAMDCFTISIVCGVILRRWETPVMLRFALLCGLFQALMPLAGWALTSSFEEYIQTWDHWLAFGMLALIGGKMIYDSFQDENPGDTFNPRRFSAEVLLAVATSIDALAVGISYACTGYDTVSQMSAPLWCIGTVSFAMSLLGGFLGVKFGSIVARKLHPELLGGIILLTIGVKILLEHLEII